MQPNYSVTDIKYETTRRGVNAYATLRAKDGRRIACIEDFWYECGGSHVTFLHTTDLVDFMKEARLAGYSSDSEYGRYLLEETERLTELEQNKNKKQERENICDSYSSQKKNFYKNASEEELLFEVKYNGILVANIENPSEAIQIAAVSKHGRAIVGIKNPTENACLASVRNKGKSIAFIKNPSISVQVEALIQGMPKGKINLKLLANNKTSEKFSDAALDTIKQGLANQVALIKTLASTTNEYEELLMDWMEQATVEVANLDELGELTLY